MNDKNKYLNILKKYNKELWNVAEQIDKNSKPYDSVERVMAQVGGPVIYLYVLWVLEEAKKKGIKRLYFLARDGQIFYEVAKIICECYHINIECRYLYCSRIAWRVPQYFLMGEKCLDYICQRSMSLTIRKMFDRILLSDEEIAYSCNQLKIEKSDINRILNHDEIGKLKRKMQYSAGFMQLVFKKSQEAYKNTVEYFEQEGLLDGLKIVLVDTGWVGSMQQSLEELLSHFTNKKVEVCGFYFGMFRKPPNTQNEYYTYLFSAGKDLRRKVIFNNNLLECMCGAPHGMTMKYIKNNGKLVPQFSTAQNLNSERWNVKNNHKIICEFTRKMSEKYSTFTISYKESTRLTSRLLYAFMMTPSVDEAEKYGTYLFSDDMTENGVLELAPRMTERELAGEDFIPKVYKRLFIKDTKKRQTKSYWIEGSIARSHSLLGGWHRLNGRLWHLLQFAVYN